MGRMVTLDLIELKETVNEYGDWVVREIRSQAYAEEYSVSQKEFYQAMTQGFRPETKFVLTNWLDYHGEEIIEYVPFAADPEKPVRLRVLRTYNDGDRLEITCYRGVEVKDGYPKGTDQN